MPSRKVTLTAAAAGAVGGLATLTILAIPTGATAAPELPTITAEQLIDNVVAAEPPAFGGTVEVENGLGLPAVPGVPELANGAHAAQAWSDGDGRGRLSIPDGSGEQTIVDDGETVWHWDSAAKTVTKVPAGGLDQEGQPEVSEADIASQAKELLAQVREFSEVTVDGTATVADRPVYELAVTPKPDERTLLREIRISVDSETWLPLQLTVLANNHTDPVIQAGFSAIEVGPQDASLFTFTPPEGATVEEADPAEEHTTDEMAPDAIDFGAKVIGEGWDTTFVAQIPTDTPAPSTEDGEYGDQGPQDPLGLASQFGKPVSGAWGDGWLIETTAATALVTSDGWVAVGAVPEQVLIEALGQAK